MSRKDPGQRSPEPQDQTRVAYSQTEAAAILGVTRQHIANSIAAGHIRAGHLGRRVLIPASEIARILNGDPQTRART